MKKYFIMTTIIMLLLLFAPLFVFINNEQISEKSNNVSSTAAEVKNNNIEVLRINSNKAEEMNISDYLIGAVAYEMPASFHEEALKAQAVACYTYAKYLKTGNKIITDNSEKHQGYLSDSELKEKWGEKYNQYYNKIKSCVNEVSGQYISYDGEPILAAYHALSAGETNCSSDCWNADLPYLVSVSAPGDKLSKNYDTTVTYNNEEIKNILKNNNISIKAINKKLITDIKYNNSGYVTKLTINNKTLNGEQARALFNLSSSSFTYRIQDGQHIFNVKGKGHGVGMSQYSADFMARQGSSYKEILAHFYQNTKLQSN